MKIGTPMTEDMVAFLDVHADELSAILESKTTRQDLVRECVARVAWDYFGIDIDNGD